MAIADQNDPITVISEPPLTSPAAALIRNAVHQHLAAGDLEAVRWFCLHPETPEDVLTELCDRGVCLDDLGHRKGPRKLLEKLAEEHRYPEAVLSLALELFENPRHPASDFADFSDRHRDDEWMLETLVRRGVSSSDEKTAALDKTLAGHRRKAEFQAIRETRALAERAATMREAAELDRLFDSGEPEVWLSLASNPAAPRELLAKLAAIEGVKNAREIRNQARRRLNGR